MTRRRVVMMTGLLLGATLLAACANRASLPKGTPVERVGVWQVSVANAPDPPRVGDNVLLIGVRDSTGSPMHGSIDVVVSMPAMGAMPYMESRGKVQTAGAGTWRAEYGLAMSGEWDVLLRLQPRNGPAAEAQYRISTSLRGVSLAGETAVPSTAATPAGADSMTGAIAIDAGRRQALGIRTETIGVRDLRSTIRVPGRVAYDEARQTEVTMRFGGYVRDLVVDVTGRPVRRGQVLFTAYSPELWSAQQEYLAALEATNADRDRPGLATASGDLARAARVRLELWGLSSEDIEAVARSGKPREAFPVRAPASGVVTEKNVVAGSAFMPAQRLYRIARLDPIWVIASVQQSELRFVRPGMEATIRDPYSDAGRRRGRVAFVYPALDSMTRTAEVRITVANPDGALQPGTYVDAELVSSLGRRVAVPESAVLPTAERHLVFIDLGDGRLAAREVRLGARAGGYYEVLDGLAPGDVVVTSGNFLVGAESKLRSAAQKW